MGTLVFQATLGGAVNIIGPNIASTINFTLPSADGTSGQTWTTNGSGVLAFGTLGIAGGGTGQITATAAFNALAPSQTGNSGKYLTTDGTNTSWATNPLGTVTSVAATVPSFLSISGSPITTSGTLAFSLSGTALPTTSGGTGLTSFTSGGVVYASSTSALATGSALTFDGTMLSSAVARFGTYATFGTESLQVAKANGTGAVGSAYQFAINSKTVNNRAEMIMTDGASANCFISYAPNFTAASDRLTFNLQGSDIVTMVGNGNVGIGTSSPNTKLQVNGGAVIGNGTVGAPASGYQLRITADSVDYYDFGRSGSTGYFTINASQASPYRGFIWAYGGTAQATLDSAGNLGLGVTPSAWSSYFNRAIQVGSTSSLADGSGFTLLGNNYYYGGANYYLTTAGASRYYQNEGKHIWESAASGTAGNVVSFTQVLSVEPSKSLSLQGATPQSGVGITFPATQSASSNANTLDDYEEGTWTPALGGFSSITYSAQTGTYTKIGNVVNVVCKIVVSGGTRTSADLQVFSLPFTSASQENSGGSWGYGYGVVASSVGLPQLRINASATTVSLLNTAGGVLAGTDLNTATPTINFSATYTV